MNKPILTPKEFLPDDQLVIRNLLDVEPVRVRWLWENRLAKGKLALFQGEPGQGKSQVTISIASILSLGGTLPDGQQCEMGRTLFITAEDEASDTLVPRLLACGADRSYINELQWVNSIGGKKVLFNFEKYLPQLKKAVASLDDLKLIVVDPISAFLGKIDSNTSGEVRGLMYELKVAAEERDCAVVMIIHNNKTAGQKALSRASGSSAFGAAVRMGSIFGEKPLEPGAEAPEEKEYVMVSSKNNLGPEPPSLLYKISPHTVVRGDKEINTSKIVWLGNGDYSSQDIVDYMPGKSKVGRPAKTFEKCLEELGRLTYRRETINPPETKEIKDELLSMDFKEQMIKKARVQLGYSTLVLQGDQVMWKRDINQF